MSRRERQRSFALAVVAVVAAIVAVSALGGSDDRSRAPRPEPIAAPAPHVRPRPAAANRRATDDGPSVPLDATARRERVAVKRVARRFIAAFARYQARRLDASTTRTLRLLATPELATYLIAQPPRVNPVERARPRVARLDVTAPAHGRVKAAALLAYSNQRSSLFELGLERSGTRWRVAELYPSGG